MRTAALESTPVLVMAVDGRHQVYFTGNAADSFLLSSESGGGGGTCSDTSELWTALLELLAPLPEATLAVELPGGDVIGLGPGVDPSLLSRLVLPASRFSLFMWFEPLAPC
jgi:hypothetical protein